MKSLLKALFTAAIFACTMGTVAMAQSAVKTDSLETITTNLSGFNHIKIAGPFDVHLVQGTTESVKYIAGPDVKNRITAKVSGGVLKIHNTHDNWGNGYKSWYGEKSVWHNHKKIAVYITAINLESISVSGSGDVAFADGFKAPGLRLRVRGSGEILGSVDVKKLNSKLSGSGSIKLSGNAEISKVHIAGSGHFEGGSLVTINSAAHVSGSGNAKVNASDKVDAAVRGSGVISYTNAKTINISKSGSGEVSRF
jgi:hypothetical protein